MVLRVLASDATPIHAGGADSSLASRTSRRAAVPVAVLLGGLAGVVFVHRGVQHARLVSEDTFDEFRLPLMA